MKEKNEIMKPENELQRQFLINEFRIKNTCISNKIFNKRFFQKNNQRYLF